jgi:hypothetical protein
VDSVEEPPRRGDGERETGRFRDVVMPLEECEIMGLVHVFVDND